MHRVKSLVVAGSAAALSMLGQVGPASACGGTFCDSGPTAMPVDQTGENVLFVTDGQTVEAHVQIQYQGSPDRFAWIVPMPKVPEVSVGSQLLFQRLLSATVPSYGFTVQRDNCGSAGRGGNFSGSAGSAGSGGGFDAATDAGGPTVVFKATVGAFEVTVIEGGTATQVQSWLETNGYQSIPTAPAILADYVAQNFVFAAIKLTAGRDTTEIHPLVFKYPGNEPCVPLKLTAVAATEDMGVRTFFLGDDRVYPMNYKHIELNPVRLDWVNRGSNYVQVVSRAVDSAVADGKAFVTEYAGASNVVGTFGVYDDRWNGAKFQNATPETVMQELFAQGLVTNRGFGGGGGFGGASSMAGVCQYGCQWSHPLIQPIVNQYLPVPSGLDEASFYNCVSCYATQVDRTRWDAVKLAADVQARIVDPGKHARDLLIKWPYLTRLFTTISPREMTLDPTFHARPDKNAERVPASGGNAARMSTERLTCDGRGSMTLPDRREVALANLSWPSFSSRMPFAERIEEVPASGPLIVLINNTAKINDELLLWNRSQGWDPPPRIPSGFAGGPSGSSGGAPGAAGAGGTRAPSPFATDGEPSATGGCGCQTVGQTTTSGVMLALAALGLSLCRRRSSAV